MQDPNGLLTDEEYDELMYLQLEAANNDFDTMWSVDSKCGYNGNLYEKSPYRAKYMGDGLTIIKLELPRKRLTWMELWEYADLFYHIAYGGGNSHRWVETFEKKGDTIEVFFGS